MIKLDVGVLVCMCDMIYGQRSDAVDGWIEWIGWVYIYIWFGTTPTETKKKKENNKKTRIVIKIYKGFKLLELSGKGGSQKTMRLEGGFGGIKKKAKEDNGERSKAQAPHRIFFPVWCHFS